MNAPIASFCLSLNFSGVPDRVWWFQVATWQFFCEGLGQRILRLSLGLLTLACACFGAFFWANCGGNCWVLKGRRGSSKLQSPLRSFEIWLGLIFADSRMTSEWKVLNRFWTDWGLFGQASWRRNLIVCCGSGRWRGGKLDCSRVMLFQTRRTRFWVVFEVELWLLCLLGWWESLRWWWVTRFSLWGSRRRSGLVGDFWISFWIAKFWICDFSFFQNLLFILIGLLVVNSQRGRYCQKFWNGNNVSPDCSISPNKPTPPLFQNAETHPDTHKHPSHSELLPSHALRTLPELLKSTHFDQKNCVAH